MAKVALDYAPAFVGQQLPTLLPAGVDFDALQAQTDEELGRCAHDADVLITARTRIDARALALMPGVRFIQHLGVGYDNLDVAAIEAAGIAAANNPAFCARSAGSAGAVGAARLSADPTQRVLLVEGDPDYPTLAETPP